MMGETPDKEYPGHDPGDTRVGRVLNDFLDRRARGEAVSEAELLAQHEEIADELRGYLALLQDLRPSPEQEVAKLVTDGVLSPPADSSCMAVLGRFKITGFIGQGGMGVVLKAIDESLNRTIALKLLRPDLARDRVALSRFHREAKAAAATHHPNIVTVHALGEEHETHYIVMDFVDGPSLSAVIGRQGPLPAPQVRILFRQLMLGLEAAHRAGLIHRDIKPSNILLEKMDDPESEEPLVKITDFGLARLGSAASTIRSPRMTPSSRILTYVPAV